MAAKAVSCGVAAAAAEEEAKDLRRGSKRARTRVEASVASGPAGAVHRAVEAHDRARRANVGVEVSANAVPTPDGPEEEGGGRCRAARSARRAVAAAAAAARENIARDSRWWRARVEL